MILYDVKNLSVSYAKNKKPILKNISFQIEQGQFVSIIGPNASGKSTLIKVLAKVIKKQSGSVVYNQNNNDKHSYNNVDINNISPKDYAKLVSYVPQINTFPEDLTVYEFIKMGRFPYTSMFIDKDKDGKKIIADAINKVSLNNFQHEYISNLSGGQKQRALIAMALVQNTDVILLDEPTNHLDIKYQLEIIHLLHHLNHICKKTIILVIHDINHGLKFSDKLIIMKDGIIFKQGEPSKIINKKIIKDVFEINADIIKFKDKKIISDYWIDNLKDIETYK